ncbi:MAG: MFS transporter [Candidatus Sumerlaeaceae bacterium]|nr:MFS transporter [Candidatus Sumerlaeaceae bacterium]
MLIDGRPEGRAWVVLAMNTLAFTFCFACWTMNGVLITFLISNGIFDWSRTQMAVLLATPVLTGSVMRLPVGLMTDRFGGRIVYFVLMLVAAAFLALNYFANSFAMFVVCALGFGLSGASFAVGIAYSSVWFPKNMQGTALGIFGAGNAGAAVTTLAAPSILKALTQGGASPEGWRMLPVIYAAALTTMAILFWFATTTRVVDGGRDKTLARQLAPLADVRVWRFGFYYFLVFGCFVALAQWLVPYYVTAYGVSLAVAGLYASIFSFPSGVIRAVCGWISDKIGARASLYWTFALCGLFSFLLIFPEMLVRTPGEGIIARVPGVVESVSDQQLRVKTKSGGVDVYNLKTSGGKLDAGELRSRFLPLPEISSEMRWNGTTGSDGTAQPFKPGDKIAGKQLLARGTTTVFFQANIHIFTLFVLLLGLAMGLGKAAVYKHIPAYFPNDVGAVGGIVGVIGGLGGFVCPIIFGILLDWTGIWTTCWIFMFLLSVACLAWMHFVVRAIMKKEAPTLLYRVEHPEGAGALDAS